MFPFIILMSLGFACKYLCDFQQEICKNESMEDNSCLQFGLSKGIGPKTFLKLIKHFGTAKNAWNNLELKSAKELGIGEKTFLKFESSKKELDIEKYLQKLEQAKVNIVGFTNPLYPSSIKLLDSPPIVLFCKGNSELLKHIQNIGVVGARKITSYGKDVTEKLTSDLVLNDFCIVSGLAFGVDAVAHKTALEHKGKTIAVLGCGVDCVTPLENERLYEEILDNGGLIISEYRLGLPPSAGSFPARNRIIAALSLGVLVTEAAEDSGSLITAEEALKLQKPVFAVPGSINAQMSQGTLKLLKQGAHIVTNSQDILEKLEIKPQDNKKKDLDLSRFSENEKLILELIQQESLSMDEISKKTKIPVFKILGIITNLELQGIMRNNGGEVSLV